MRPGSEEYLDSEKYQIRIRDWAEAEAEGRTLAPYLTRLNEIRRAHPALQLLRNLTVHSSDDDNVLVLQQARRGASDGSDDMVIVVVNLDPHGTRETTVHLDMPALGLDWQDSFVVHDEITGADLDLGHEHNYVRLDPLRRARPRARPCGGTRDRSHPARPDRASLDDAPTRLVQDRGLLRGAGPLLPRLQRRRRR